MVSSTPLSSHPHVGHLPGQPTLNKHKTCNARHPHDATPCTCHTTVHEPHIPGDTRTALRTIHNPLTCCTMSIMSLLYQQPHLA
jgi:hypothetical protein